jgi:hypothetical protein
MERRARHIKNVNWDANDNGKGYATPANYEMIN